MKKFIFILAAIVFYSLLSCSEDKIDTYHGEDFIYFSDSVGNNGLSYYWKSSRTFNFFFTTAQEASIALPVSAGGMVSESDRTFLVEPEVDGDAVEGLDFELSREQIMPAKKSKTNVYVKLKRRAEMEGKTFTVKVHLKPNENFTTNFPVGIDLNNDTVSRKVMDVICQAELTAPAYYNSNKSYIGYWSVLKFNTMNEVLDLTLDDWLDAGNKKGILYGTNFNNYMNVFGNYLNRKISEGPDAAIKDPDAQSTRGYMTMPGFPYFGIPTVVIPANFPTTPEWKGNQ